MGSFNSHSGNRSGSFNNIYINKLGSVKIASNVNSGEVTVLGDTFRN